MKFPNNKQSLYTLIYGFNINIIKNLKNYIKKNSANCYIKSFQCFANSFTFFIENHNANLYLYID